MFEEHLWNTCLLYVAVKIQQLAHKISSFQEKLYKRGDLKNFSKFKDKHKEYWSGVVSV